MGENLRKRIVERIEGLDTDALRALETLLADEQPGLQLADAGETEPRLLSRRQLLAGLLTGGVALGSTNLATAWYAREQGMAAGWQLGAEAVQAQLTADSAPAWEKMQAEIDALRGLVAHYEALERVDLDLAIAQSIERFESSLASLPAMSQPVVDGIAAVRGAIDRFQAAVPAIQQGIAQVDDTLNSLDERLEGLRQVLEELMERAAPIADNLGAFFDTVVDRIPFNRLTVLPFGIGDRVELVAQRTRQLIEAVPVTIAAVRDRLLSPLRSTWFADTDEDGVQGDLLTPIRSQLLAPAEQLLSYLDDVTENWQREVTEPAHRALAERQAIRRAMAEYKQRHGL